MCKISKLGNREKPFCSREEHILVYGDQEIKYMVDRSGNIFGKNELAAVHKDLEH